LILRPFFFFFFVGFPLGLGLPLGLGFALGLGLRFGGVFSPSFLLLLGGAFPGGGGAFPGGGGALVRHWGLGRRGFSWPLRRLRRWWWNLICHDYPLLATRGAL